MLCGVLRDLRALRVSNGPLGPGSSIQRLNQPETEFAVQPLKRPEVGFDAEAQRRRDIASETHKSD